jgi:transcriptional regulator with XRE-family HTH domain
MGVDRAYVSALELGRRNPTALTLWHTAQALGIKMTQLLEESGEPLPTAPPEKKRASKKPAS